MNNYVIISDSCADLSINQVIDYDLEIIPLSFEINDNSYLDYPDQRELDIKKFYEMLRDGKRAFTSMIPKDRFIVEFEKHLTKNEDILFIAFSSGLSGTYDQALKAKLELEAKYPNNKILVIDSLSASMGQGLLLYYAAKLKKSNKSILEVAKWVEDNRLRVVHLFTIQSLMHLKRGGRLSYTKALVGSILRLKPILHVSDEGKLVPMYNVRGRRKALDELFNQIKENIMSPEEQVIFISHGDDLIDANNFKDRLINELKVKDVIINTVGPVIGAHSGQDTIAVFFIADKR